MTRAALPLLFEAGDARIVNVARGAGSARGLGETIYAGAKGGVAMFTKSLAREVVHQGVMVNCVCPVPTDAPMYAKLPKKMPSPLTKAIPMKRLARPKEIADAILFFAGDHAGMHNWSGQ